MTPRWPREAPALALAERGRGEHGRRGLELVLRRAAAVVLAASFLAVTLGFPEAPAATPVQSETPAPALGPGPKIVPEKLVYRVEWNPPWYFFFLPTMEAGEAELGLGEAPYRGRTARRITFRARSSGTLVKLSGVVIDDDFQFLSDPETFCALSATKTIREGKRKHDVTVEYEPRGGSLHIRDVDVARSPGIVRRDETVRDVPPCVKDLFSALYWARGRPFADGSSESSVVADDARIKEVKVRVLGSERVTTPKGSFDTWKLETIALLGGLFRDGGEFHFWLTKDEQRVPVQFEAKVKLGKVSGKLVRMEP